ncbi:MAG TPA: hypothetical protein VK874_09205 [Gaiellaceae bacterium]|nr:hypothetical protein [Gaiellaceae bacterium]
MLVAATSWPDAIVAVAGVLGVFGLIAVIVWQVLATGRVSIATKREQAYKELAEEAAEAQARTAARLTELVSEVQELRVRATELERMLKEVA